MSRLFKYHEELINGEGKCSVPMWCMGGPAGFCDNPAYGFQLSYKQFKRNDGTWFRTDGGYDGYVPALACPAHGGPTKEQVLNLCDYCSKRIADCDGRPMFGCGRGNDNVYSCDGFMERKRNEGQIKKIA